MAIGHPALRSATGGAGPLWPTDGGPTSGDSPITSPASPPTVELVDQPASLLELLEQVLGSTGGDAASARALLDEHGFGDLPADLLGEAIHHYADTLPADEAAALAPVLDHVGPLGDGDLDDPLAQLVAAPTHTDDDSFGEGHLVDGADTDETDEAADQAIDDEAFSTGRAAPDTGDLDDTDDLDVLTDSGDAGGLDDAGDLDDLAEVVDFDDPTAGLDDDPSTPEVHDAAFLSPAETDDPGTFDDLVDP